jgi:UDP-N-acetylmuramate-alanine ligase
MASMEANIATAIGSHACHVDSLDEANQRIQSEWSAGDVIITLGAGNVNTLCTTLGDLLHG